MGRMVKEETSDNEWKLTNAPTLTPRVESK